MTVQWPVRTIRPRRRSSVQVTVDDRRCLIAVFDGDGWWVRSVVTDAPLGYVIRRGRGWYLRRGMEEAGPFLTRRSAIVTLAHLTAVAS